METDPNIEISDSRRILEIIAVVLTGLFKFVLVDLYPHKFWFILFASLFWIFYIILCCRKNPSALTNWGFRRLGFQSSFLGLLPYALICLLSFSLYGILKGTLILNWHIFPILILYPIWGTLQQFLIVGLIAGNLVRLNRYRFSKVFITVATAVIFSVVHYPSLYLIAGTFILALVYVPNYLVHHNLWSLGLYHGWLACFFYFFVLQRDPWHEVIGTF